MAVHKITIVTEMIDKISGKATRVRKTIKDMGNGIQKTSTQMKSMGDRGATLNKTIKQTTTGFRRFRMEFLSVLFFGMAIQRLFTGIARGAVNAFTKIIESSGIMTSALSKVTAYFTFLGFEVGRALDTALRPLLPIIWKIVNAVSKWIQKHPKLTSGIIGLGIALGGLMFILATFKLGMDGLVMILGGKAGLLGILSALVSPVGLIAAALAAALVIGWVFNKEGVQKKIDDIIQSIKAGEWGDLVIGIIGFLDEIVKGLNNAMNKLAEWIGTKLHDKFVELADKFSLLFEDGLKSAVDTMFDYIKTKVKDLGAPKGGGVPFLGGNLEVLKSFGKGFMTGSRQFGGPINQTGMHMMHRGETVVPASRAGGSGAVNITINGNVDEDVYKKLVRELRRYGPQNKIGR